MNSMKRHQHAVAVTLLRDAHLTELSDTTRIAVAFEAGILFLLRAPPFLIDISGLHTQKEAALVNWFESLCCSASDRRLGLQLREWYRRRYELPSLPCSTNDAISWAVRMSRLSQT